METSRDSLDLVKVGLEVLSLITTVALGYIALLIRNVVVSVRLQQANDKAELIEHNQTIKDDLLKSNDVSMSKIYSIDLTLASHVVQDTERFNALGNSLARIESKVDRNFREKDYNK